MQGLMLAAGMGKRLGKYTKNNTKCMVKVGDKTLIERTCEALKAAGINKLIMVVGYESENLKKFMNENIKNMEIIFIDNPDYAKSNNIYSLYLAKDYLTKEDTILLESDLIYDYDLLKSVVEEKEKNVVAVAKYEQWMDGTVVTLNNDNFIEEFIEKKDFKFNLVNDYYKTVNIYKLSKEFSEQVYVPFLEAYIKAYGLNEYYELVLKAIAHLSRSNLKACDVSKYNWYEIDDGQDLDIASCLFTTGKEKLENFQKRYGGYWRFNKVLDYCYLVNPYFPNEKLYDQMLNFTKNLISQYPSGSKTLSICANRLFGVDEDNIIVGNGAAELINILGHILKGKVLITLPAFNEYVRCFENNCEFNVIHSKEDNYNFNIGKIKSLIDDSDIVTIINPDNPSGSFIEYDDIINIIEECNRKNKKIIIDESFIDFADSSIKYTLLNDELLNKYPNLIVVKSISKSYGVPGMRLGVLATSDDKLKKEINDNMSVWNINSFGEYFLQIANLYKKEYNEACEKITFERQRFMNNLKEIDGLKVYNSQANYLLLQLENLNSTDLAIKLLENDIFIKDLRTKKEFLNEDYIRLAIRNEEDNDTLIKVLKNVCK